MIGNIEHDEKMGSCIFRSSDIELVNLYRRAILSEIETFAIEYVCFDVNNTSLHDESIALRLGLLVIDNEKFIADNLHEDLYKRYYVDISGPSKFTSDDIIGLPFFKSTPISELQQGERIKCFVEVRKNIGREHVKWRPVGSVAIAEINEGLIKSQLNIGKELKIQDSETHYIDTVLINKNSTYIKDYFLATQIAELQIDYDKVKKIEEDEIMISWSKTGPGYFISSNDNLQIPFKPHLNIGELGYTYEISKDYRPEYDDSVKYIPQEISCNIIIKRGQRKNFIKWKSSKYNYNNDITGYHILINNLGMLTTEHIFEEGLKKIRTAASRADTPTTIFHKVRVPTEIPEEIPY